MAKNGNAQNTRRKIRRKENLSEAFFMSRLPFDAQGKKPRRTSHLSGTSKPEPFTHRRVRHPREFQPCFGPTPVPRAWIRCPTGR